VGALALRFRTEGVVERLGLDDGRPLQRVMSISRQCSRMKVPYVARARGRWVVREGHRQRVSAEQYTVRVMPSCGKASAEVVIGVCDMTRVFTEVIK
jgi:predicted transcriptional regulator